MKRRRIAAPADPDTLEVRSREELRAWLSEHSRLSEGVWLVRHRKASPHHLRYPDMVEELLCWGWIDSQTRSLDDPLRTSQRITPRRIKTSVWSQVNKRLVENARATGAMTPAGEDAIRAAMANGMWDALNHLDQLPDDLAAALGDAGQTVWRDEWPAYVQKGTVYWVTSAKRDATRAKRIQVVVDCVDSGQRPPMFRKKQKD